MKDSDLDIKVEAGRGGEGVILFALPAFILWRFLLFVLKIRGKAQDPVPLP